MFGILLSALNVIVGFIFRSIIIKFVLYFALWFVTTEALSILTSYLPTSSALTGALSGISPGVWYFLDLFSVTYGIPTVLSAFVTRFIIRRVPLIG